MLRAEKKNYILLQLNSRTFLFLLHEINFLFEHIIYLGISGFDI